MENVRYFERPKQVMFADPDNPGEWLAGIAYREVIICGCCGGVFTIDEVLDMADEDGLSAGIYPYEDWTDIACEIAGGEPPAGLRITLLDETDEEESDESEEYEAFYFKLDEDEEVQAVFANTWVDGIAMPEV